MKRFYLSIMWCMLAYCGKAQVLTEVSSKPIVPLHGKYGGQRHMKKIVLPPPASPPQVAEPALKEGVYKFAEPVAVNINLLTQAGVSVVNGKKVFCLKLRALKATSVSLDFENFHLSGGAEMYLYNAAGTILTGPVTAAENKPSGLWGSDLYSGDAVIIELKVPEAEVNQCTATIAGVGYGFRDLPSAGGRFGDAGACNVNAVCPAGNGWQAEQSAVAMILDSQGGSWTGTLINNTCNNRVPYVLTASHAATLAITQPISRWRFIFQYKSATCAPLEDGSRHLLFNGATLRANSSWSDFALVEMDQVPPQNSGITYAGWDRTGALSPNGTCFHHPQGDVMKVSYDAEPILRTPYPGAVDAVYWQADWNQGVTERGSSGSALFNAGHKIIGQLRGGYSSCASANLKDYYGAIDVSWIGSVTPATRLKDWLDPSGTNATVLAGIPSSYYSIAGTSQFCNSAVYTVTNLPAGAVVNWQQPSPAGVVSLAVSGNQAAVTRITDGLFTLQATITLCGRTITITSNEIRSGAFPMQIQTQQTSCNTAVFTLAGNLPDATYNWSTGAGDILFNGTSPNAVTAVQYIAATGTIGTIAVSTINSCGATGTYYADFMPYVRELQYGMYQPMLNGDHIAATVEPSEFVKEYWWYLNGQLVQAGSNNSYNSSTTPGESNIIVCGNNTLKVDAVTDCGTYAMAFDDHIEKACGNSFKTTGAVQLYPNPASSNIVISLKKNMLQLSKSEKENSVTCIKQVVLYDKLGNISRIQNFTGWHRLVNIDVSLLPPGIYFAEISDGVHKVREQLSIKR
jgi:lysyl endopeptidase